MSESIQKPTILELRFYCQYAEDFELNIELIDANRVQGLQDGWDKAIKHFCPNDIQKMQKLLKRKLGSIYNFDDLSDIVMRFINANGKRDEIRVTTNYPMIG